ncbi:SDR family oxidoreductase [Paenarthrobacter sp. CM16]|uniref:SDR family oxidoreductase n=1 Tax=Paenarthrobacter sp. CM16 TaxID=2738447 RepID=UPI001551C05F|nr:SDR family oxidoreductase [Paenarthrobacter sp. CM16]NQD89337.1 SDR family oxidoreductase [Paenarthrobacter sp. CM16]
MNVSGKVAIVTGAGSGIGAALAAGLAGQGAHVVVADLDLERTSEVAAAVGGVAVAGDASRVEILEEMIAAAEGNFGPVDLFFANAGVSGEAGIGDSDEQWQRALDINVLAHIRAARLLVPGWIERGSGYFVSTASAAGLLTQIAAGPYSVTKHAAVGFSEWLSVTYGDRGVRVSCICPMGVNTAIHHDALNGDDEVSQLGAKVVATAGSVLEPEEVAAITLAAMQDEKFLILPHPEVLEYYRRKGADYDRWLAGMRRLQREAANA